MAETESKPKEQPKHEMKSWGEIFHPFGQALKRVKDWVLEHPIITTLVVGAALTVASGVPVVPGSTLIEYKIPWKKMGIILAGLLVGRVMFPPPKVAAAH